MVLSVSDSTLRTPEKPGLQQNADHKGMNQKWRKSGNLSPFQKTQMTFDCPTRGAKSQQSRRWQC